MKLNYQEKKQLQILIKNELVQLKKYILNVDLKSKEYSKLVDKKELLIKLNKKLDNTSIQGASSKQIDALKKTAKKKQFVSKSKIQNAINLLNLLNKRITLNSVAIEASMSYNTVKKYKTMIEEAEIYRTQGVLKC
jgi:hypothetical protein